MNVKKIVATSAREALRQVKVLLGDDAVILTNRNVAGGVEITAVSADEIAAVTVPARAPRSEPGRPAAIESEDDDGYRVSLGPTATARPAARLAAADRGQRPHVDFSRTPASPAHRADEPSAEVVPNAVMEELRALRQMVEQQLAGFAWRDMTEQDPARGALLRHMLDAGFSPVFARDSAQQIPAGLGGRAAIDWAQDSLARELRGSAPGMDLIDQGGVFALVGPTGVGKTTTAAKLAARCVLRHGANRVALVTTDGYRIGAHEQLRIYGRILGVPVHSVRDGLELKATLRDLGGKHMVIIDTMGMSQRDKNVAAQSALLSDARVQRLLLLSATSRSDTLDDVVSAYGQPGLAGCIVSKVDEAVGLAGALDAVIRHRLPLHYVSNGQRVPEDLHQPNALYLAHRAFKNLPEDSPHRHRDIEPALLLGGLAAGAGRA
jgi:flagellar biosynthesis protein FlhF